MIMLDKKRIGINRAHHHSVMLMGCHFVLTAVHQESQMAWDAIRAGIEEISRIERLISSWDENSEASEINRCAGLHPVKVDKELFALILRSIKISELTAGAFDITGTLSRRYWPTDQREYTYLSKSKIDELKSLIDYRKIELDVEESTVFLRHEGMMIGFGGIGKGYAALRASQVMKEVGVSSGLINASGDLMAWGSPPNQDMWKVNIPDPEEFGKYLYTIEIPQGSVVSSGCQFNYCTIDQKRYSHIVDPRTGIPVTSMKNVSVVSPNPEFADAMATAISVMDIDDGLALTERMNGVDCIITEEGGAIHSTGTFKSYFKNRT